MMSKKIIDCHVHVTANGTWYHTDYDASLNRLLREMEDSPISRAILLPTGTNETEIRKATDYIISLVDGYPEKLIGFHGYFQGFDLDKEFDERLKGIKVHPRTNSIDLSSSMLDLLYAQAAEKRMPLLIDSYCTPISSISPEKIRPNNYWDIAEKNPTLTIIMAHCGMPFIWEAYLPLKWHPNLYADISHTLMYFKGTSLLQDLAWVVKKIPHKICYGSDFPEVSLKKYYDVFIGFCEKYEIDPDSIIYNSNRFFI